MRYRDDIDLYYKVCDRINRYDYFMSAAWLGLVAEATYFFLAAFFLRAVFFLRDAGQPFCICL